MKVLVYLEEEKLAPKGGPLAVGFYYHEEMKRRGDNTLEFVHADAKSLELHTKGRALTSRLPNWINKIHRTIRLIINRKRLLSGKEYAPERNFDEYDIIHFHQPISLFLERKNLENYKGIVLYQPHSPVPVWQEFNNDLPKLYHLMIPDAAEKSEAIDKYAMSRADYLIFPCKEAEDPYIDNWDFFRDKRSVWDKKFRYVLTGTKPAHANRNRSEVLHEYGIPDDGFVISYIGRHNSVKGFDILKKIAAKYLEEEHNAWVISAGLESPIKRLEHERWKEIGFTSDPHSIISASDVFVLPNRSTYFDIVMLENLSLGAIVIASRTGGNKWFEKEGVKGVLLYDTVDEAVNLLKQVNGMNAEERNNLKRSNSEYFDKMLTSSAMYDRYMAMLCGLIGSTQSKP